MERLKTREDVAEILEASGLGFKRKCFNCNGSGYLDTVLPTHSDDKCLLCAGAGEISRFPTVNQTEAILEKLGVQVAKRCCVWILADKRNDPILIKDEDYDYKRTVNFEINLDDRELANAAAVAWFALKEPEKLKDAVAVLEQQK